mgnify:CR=1 FL=1
MLLILYYLPLFYIYPFSLSRYLETKCDQYTLKGKRILELGAGAGLTSMVAALHVGAEGAVYATEQNTCLPYLEVSTVQSWMSYPLL